MNTKSKLPAIPRTPVKLVIMLIIATALIVAAILAIRLGVIGGSNVEATITDRVQDVESIKSGKVVAAITSTNPEPIKSVETVSEKKEIQGIVVATTGLMKSVGSAIPEYIEKQQTLSTKVNDAENSIASFIKSLDFYHSKLEFIQDEQKSTKTSQEALINKLSTDIETVKSLVAALERRIVAGSKASTPVATNSSHKPKVVPPIKLVQIAKWNGVSVATVRHQGQSISLKANQIFAGWTVKKISTHCLLLAEGKHEANLCIL